ncbi:MAG TPA: hypothetical protein PK156_23245 [Polyangium sp.]|nr:hypothetical protein [Polyangium sp.]
MTTCAHEQLLADYVDAFLRGQKPAQSIDGVQARLCRRKPGEPVQLSDDPARRIVFLIDHHVCHDMIGLSGYQIATTILGWDPQYTRRKVDAGLIFDLVVFPETTCTLGTWENLLNLVEMTYPEVGAKIMRHRSALCAMTPESLIEIERCRGYTFLEVDEHGQQDPRFMTLPRYIEAPDTLEAARAFLYHVVYCKELYSGCGRTLGRNGHRGVPEYIMPVRPLEALGTHRVIPIDVKIPEGLEREH